MALGLSRHAVDRLRELVQSAEVEDATAPREVNPRPFDVQFVEVTSTTQTSGRYPGTVYAYNAAASTWSATSGAVWVVDPANRLATGVKYLAKRVAVANGRPVFLVGKTSPAGITVKDATGTPTYTGITTLSVESPTAISNPAAGEARILDAAHLVAGIVSTGAQVFSGAKSFQDGALAPSFYSDRVGANVGLSFLAGTGANASLISGAKDDASVRVWVEVSWGGVTFETMGGSASYPTPLFIRTGSGPSDYSQGQTGTDSIGNVFKSGLCTTLGSGGGGGVTSFNGATGAVTLAGTAPVGVSTVGSTVTVALTYGGSLVNSSGTLKLDGDVASPGASMVYATDGSGVKGWYTQPAAGSTSPLTTKGDVWTFSTVDARLGVGSNGQALTADSSTATGLKWAAVGGSGTVTSVARSISGAAFISVSGAPVTAAGTLTDTWTGTLGDMLYASAANTWSVLAGSTNTAMSYLVQTGTGPASAAPVWRLLNPIDFSPLTAKGDLYTAVGSLAPTALPVGSNGQVLTADSSTATGLLWASVGAGTVTSVGLSLPAELSVSGSPVTTSGTLLASWASQSANLIFAGPTSGLGTSPTFRALVAADFGSNVVGFSSLAQGSARSVVGVTGNAAASVASIQGTANQVLRVNGAGTALAFGAIDVSSTSAVTGQLAAASFPALTGDVTTAGGALATTIAANAVTDAKLRQSAGLSVVGRASNSTGNVADITAASDGQVMRRSGTAIGFGAVDLTSSAAVTGRLVLASSPRADAQAKSANFTAATDPTVYACSVSGGSITATLPAASGNAGLCLWFAVTATTAGNSVTIDGNASETIAGNLTTSLYVVGDAIGLVCDGSNWQIVADARRYPGCVVIRSTTQSLTTATPTKINFDAETIDAWGMHDTVTNNTRITVPRAGRYWVSGRVAFAANATGQRRAYIGLNGSAIRYTRGQSTDASTDYMQEIGELLDLAAGDYVELLGYQSSGGNLNVSVAGTYFAATLCDSST